MTKEDKSVVVDLIIMLVAFAILIAVILIKNIAFPVMPHINFYWLYY